MEFPKPEETVYTLQSKNEISSHRTKNSLHSRTNSQDLPLRGKGLHPSLTFYSPGSRKQEWE